MSERSKRSETERDSHSYHYGHQHRRREDHHRHHHHDRDDPSDKLRRSEERHAEHRPRSERSNAEMNRKRHGPSNVQCEERSNSRYDSNKMERPSWENPKVKRHADQIHQRKLLWAKGKDAKKTEGPSPSTSQQPDQPIVNKEKEKAWRSMIAASSADTEQMTKFERLMGIRKTGNGDQSDGPGSTSTHADDSTTIESEKARQKEMRDKLDQQYASARATTHVAKGRGLGFHS